MKAEVLRERMRRGGKGVAMRGEEKNKRGRNNSEVFTI